MYAVLPLMHVQSRREVACYTREERPAYVEDIVTLQTMPFHRKLVAVWHVLTLLLLIWAFTAWRDGDEIHWMWLPLFASPLLVLFATFSAMQSNHRAVAYWVLAAIAIPSAAAGLTSVVGWMFIVSVVMLIWAARRENPADEFVQM